MLRLVVTATVATLCALAIGTTSSHAATTTHTWAAYEIGPVEPGCAPVDDCDDDINGEDINSKGWVAGFGFPDNDWPFYWRATATPTVVSPGGHEAFPGFEDTGFFGINTNGDTTGWTDDENGAGLGRSHALLYKNGTYTDLGTLQGDAGTAGGSAINDTDTVVGTSSTAAGQSHAFSWTPSGGMTDLGTLGGSDSSASSVNGNNQIVGWAEIANGNHHAFLYQSGHMSDLGTLGGGESEANSVNATGEVVGWTDTTAGAQHAFIRTGTTMTDIGKLLTNATSSIANDVTNSGDVVGTAQTATGQFDWLYTGGKMINIGVNTVTCCDYAGGALNKNLQIVSRNDSPYSETIPVLEPVTAYDENSTTIKYAGTWTRATSAGAWKGSVKTTTNAGASASLTFTGRRIWWTANRANPLSQVQIYLDGKLQPTYEPDSLPTIGGTNRQTAYIHSWAASGKHTIKIVNLATSGRTSINIDALSTSIY